MCSRVPLGLWENQTVNTLDKALKVPTITLLHRVKDLKPVKEEAKTNGLTIKITWS